jgi:prepilin-type N-terminal cleavage/methylation domain-containing protein
MGRSGKNQSGFSLSEMIVVLFVMSVILSIGCYGFMNFLPRYRLEGATRILVSDFQLTRMRAIGQNCSYRVRFLPEEECYILEREISYGVTRWPGIQEGPPRKFNLPSSPYYYPGVHLESVSRNPVFSPRGTAVGTTIVLRNSSGQKIITLSSQGRVKVEGG